MLLIDEPTTGLDSANARNIVNILKKLATRGMMVLMTIHQPSARIVQELDKVCLMSGGRMAFCGSPAMMTMFYHKHGYTCPNLSNPVDYYGKRTITSCLFINSWQFVSTFVATLGHHWHWLD